MKKRVKIPAVGGILCKQKLCEVLSFMDILLSSLMIQSTGQSENLHRLERRNAGSSTLVSAESYEICLYVWNGRHC